MFMKQMMFMISWCLHWLYLIIWRNVGVQGWIICNSRSSYLMFRFTSSILALHRLSMWQNEINIIAFPRLSINWRYKQYVVSPKIVPFDSTGENDDKLKRSNMNVFWKMIWLRKDRVLLYYLTSIVSFSQVIMIFLSPIWPQYVLT